MIRRATLAGAGLLFCLSTACGSSSSDPNDPTEGGNEFEPLFNGVDFDGFELVGISASDLSMQDGIVKCTCQPNGYLYRNDVYRNFVLALSFRFERPANLLPGADDSFAGNSGYFVYLSPPHEIWPSCLEVQGSYPETGDVFRLPGLLPGNDNPDLAALQSARRPVGEWNDLTISSQEGALTVQLNGLVVNQSTPGELNEGLVALESEGAEIHWRDVMIKRLP